MEKWKNIIKIIVYVAMHMAVIAVIIFLILLIPTAWIKQSLLLMFGAIAISDLVMLFLDNPEKPSSLIGVKILFYLGALILIIFISWIPAIIVWLVNFFALKIGSEFQLVEIFSGDKLFVFSLPALLSGLFLVAMSKIWESSYWDEKNNKGKPRRAFR